MSLAINPNDYQAKTKEVLQEELDRLSYAVTQEAGTEPAFSHPYTHLFEPGIYVDKTTGEPLFFSKDKFDSGCGWPAFSKAVTEEVVEEHLDLRYGMVRCEVRSRVGKAHLGHLFADGPKELGGRRYCINGAALSFIPKAEMEAKGYGDLLPYLD